MPCILDSMMDQGFLENSKFSAILRSEIGKENTNFSGGVLFNAPKAGWAQVGYHSLNGLSARGWIFFSQEICIRIYN